MSLSNTDENHALSLSSDLGNDDANRSDQVARKNLKYQSQSLQRHPSNKFKRIKHEHHPQPYEFKSKSQSNSFCNISGHDSRPAPNLSQHIGVPTPQEGSIYSSFEALRYAIHTWALREKFLTRIYKKDSFRAIYICRRASQGCEWRVRANTFGKHSSAVLVSIVQPHHTCNAENRQSDRTTGSEAVKPKYAKRGVQFTQRWVRDALAHCGFVVSPETDPMSIVRCIADRFGEMISDKLAVKAKISLLVARGEMLPQRTTKPGRPTRAEVEERERDMQHAMALQLDENSADQISPDEDSRTVHSPDPKIGGADAYFYLPDNNTATYAIAHAYNDPRRHPVEIDISSDYAIDPQLSGATTTTIPTASTVSITDRISVGHPQSASSDSAMTTDNIATYSLSNPGSLPCEACNGTGLSKLYSATIHSADSCLATNNCSSSYDFSKEILILQNQMVTLQKKIEALRWQQQRIHDAPV